MAHRFGIVLALVFAAGNAQAQSGERILAFDSTIAVHSDSSMTVHESIRVHAQGQQIRRGIYRDFPTVYRDTHGRKVVVGFDIEKVLRNGDPEPYHTDRQANGIRVYLGHEDRLLEYGEHTYEFTYRTSHQLGYFAEHDELYWNVTGNGWTFPIDAVSARVILPDGIAVADIATEGYTGIQGSTQRSYTAEVDGPSTARFAATRPLRPREGLTIVISFPKGFVAEPTLAEKVGFHAARRSGDLVILAGVLAILVYYLFAWFRVGMDPPKGRVLPREVPPQGWSPAALRYIQKMRPDPKTFSVALLAMAVKRYIEIDHRGGSDFLVIRGSGDESTLTPEENALAHELFEGRDRINLIQANHAIIGRARSAFFTSLKEQFRGEYFNRNGQYTLFGVLLSIAVLGIGLAAAAGDPSWIVFAGVAVLLVANVAFGMVLKAPTAKGRAVLDEFEGFKMFLNGEGMARFSPQTDPEALGQRFEQFLPYAIALDQESQWANAFTRAASVMPERTHTYYPIWYHGSAWNYANAHNFTSSLGSAFSSAIAASAMPPGSSSGSGGFSGGGGSSGGGGGGGGGGGW